MNHSNPRVALLRHQLFKPSEVFITEQARALSRYSPLLVGRELAGTPPADVSYHVPEASRRLRRLDYILTGNPQVFLPALLRHRPSVLHAHFGVEGVYGLKLAQRLKVPLVTTFHGFDATLNNAKLLTSGKPSWINYVMHRDQLRQRGALFICVSQFIRERLQRLGFPEERLRVHYIGVDRALFEERAAEEGDPIILHVARLVGQKGTTYLLEALAKMAVRHPCCRLVVIGDGPLRAQLRARAIQLGVESRVDWLGAQPHSQVRAWLARATVLCLPSCTPASGATEGLGQVLLEAAASGVPSVATLHGGIGEAVIDGHTGYLVPERDSLKLADALDALLSSPQTRRDFGLAARKMVQERFDLWNQAQALERLYAEVA